MITLEGEVYEIIYVNEDNGYTVCEIDVNGVLTVAVGHMPFLSAGETVRLTGSWITHSEYGKQLKVERLERMLPQSVSSIYSYLASGVISGIGASNARKIVDRFGEDTLDVLRSSPELLTEIKGISMRKAEAMSEAFILRQDTAETVMFFQQFGITPNLAMKIYKKFGSMAVELVRDNPYALCETVQGVGFKTCDQIAMSLGLPFDSRNRIKSGLRYALTEAAMNGHTCYPDSALLDYTAKLLGCDLGAVRDCYNESLLTGKIISEDNLAYLPLYYNLELSSASRLATLAKAEAETDKKTEELVDSYAESCNIVLSGEQRTAILTANSRKVLVITGGPGTGKTTIMKGVLNVMLRRGMEVALCAPTGKAAKRLEEACGCEAKTIHRLLEVDAISDDEQRFAKNETNPLSADFIIVDEMSMVDIQLLDALLKAMKPGAGIVMAGDVDQLPSVGAGNVLSDILESGVVPMIRLSTVFRQAEESMIVVNAHRINDGEMPDLMNSHSDFFFIHRPDHQTSADVILDLVESRLPKAYGYDLSDIQVLSPSKKGTAGVVSLNALIQERINPPEKYKPEQKRGSVSFRLSDKVIQIKNNYNAEWVNHRDGSQGLGVFNGDIGVITDIDRMDKTLTVEFDDGKTVEYDFAMLDNLELAYALTVHKSQGCEFKAVIVPVCGFAPMLMARNLLYTAITRAKEMVVLVGSPENVAQMVRNNHRSRRYSSLLAKLRLYGGYNEE
ncbi:MAG: ATP-dependent RecD-like DNA helicase [Oscillospiraceae bacterium]|nr:ATP-dependent RecD-like DNA helicase [Oscillospiraceae bacterium]